MSMDSNKDNLETTNGGRHEALKEALRCKQPLIGELKDELFSENLY